MKKIILDCDNTIGIPNCDVDDAMALFYLLGKDEADLLAITTTYGNSDISTVHSNTKRLLREIGRTDIALYRGSEKIDCGSDAARAIAKLSEEHRGELSILAVGATTNLCSALHYDPKALDGVDLVLMGGITEPLIVGSRPMDELNLSVDARATLEVLNKTKKATILTGNNCLATIFSRSEFEKNLCHTEQGRYILESTRYWFDYNESDYEAARKASPSGSRNSMVSPGALSTSTFKQRLCISLTNTLKDSGMPGSGIFSPLTMLSYTLTRPTTSSDLTVSISWRA